jgi:hypothetical protein
MVENGTVTDATLRQYGPLLERFGTVKTNIQNMLKQGADNAEFGESALGRAAPSGTAPNEHIHNLLNEPDEGRSFNALVRSLGNDPKATAGVRRSLADYITKAMSAGEKYDASGALIPDSNNGISSIETVLKRAGSVITQEQRDVLTAIQKELKDVSFSRSGGVMQNGSLGREPIPVVGQTRAILQTITKHLSNKKEVDALIHTALMDPKTAVELLKRPVKDRVARVTRTIGRSIRASAVGAGTGAWTPVQQDQEQGQ